MKTPALMWGQAPVHPRCADVAHAGASVLPMKPPAVCGAPQTRKGARHAADPLPEVEAGLAVVLPACCGAGGMAEGSAVD
jgi:hypothetical protein